MASIHRAAEKEGVLGSSHGVRAAGIMQTRASQRPVACRGLPALPASTTEEKEVVRS